MSRIQIFASVIAACAMLRFLHAADISVFAAASLKDALTEIGAACERETGDKLVFNFGASSTLARQIEQEAPADVFFSADELKMNALDQKGLLLPGTRSRLLSNTLVIVVANDARTVPKSAADLAGPAIRKLALAEPTIVPAGIYAREHLAKVGVWDSVKSKVVPTENVRAALAAVETGNVEAGVVYKTDAMISRKVTVAVEIPAAEGPKISYALAVVKASKQPDSAKKAAAYLSSPAAHAVYAKYGFAKAQ